MNAAMVSVDYADLLALTLPRNRGLFERMLIVTAPNSPDVGPAYEHNCEVYETDAFYRHGASFNKWLALELGLTERGFREGWLCLMDADVVWPKHARVKEVGDLLMLGNLSTGAVLEVHIGQLCSPLRRMLDMPGWQKLLAENGIPDEETWTYLPIHRNVAEHAGYSQVFHCSDPVLLTQPWHQVDWKHAGGADSFFQRQWSNENKIRPPFEVLHLGSAGENWFGRSSARLDGTQHPEAQQRRDAYTRIWPERRVSGFSKEKL